MRFPDSNYAMNRFAAPYGATVRPLSRTRRGVFVDGTLRAEIGYSGSGDRFSPGVFTVFKDGKQLGVTLRTDQAVWLAATGV